MEDPLKSKQSYQKYVDEKTPNSPIIKNCFCAFLVGRSYLRSWSNYF